MHKTFYLQKFAASLSENAMENLDKVKKRIKILGNRTSPKTKGGFSKTAPKIAFGSPSVKLHGDIFVLIDSTTPIICPS